MNNPMRLGTLLSEAAGEPAGQLTLFALINLGIIESLTQGLIGASDAVPFFFHAENCRFVRNRFQEKLADQIMSHGVQLPDLFEALPAEEAHREFQRELATMRSLCLKLLAEKRLVA